MCCSRCGYCHVVCVCFEVYILSTDVLVKVHTLSADALAKV